MSAPLVPCRADWEGRRWRSGGREAREEAVLPMQMVRRSEWTEEVLGRWKAEAIPVPLPRIPARPSSQAQSDLSVMPHPQLLPLPSSKAPDTSDSGPWSLHRADTQNGGCFPWGSLPVCLLTECGHGSGMPCRGWGGGGGPWICPPGAPGRSSQGGRRAGSETRPDTGCLFGPWLQAQGVARGRGTKRPLSTCAGHGAHLGRRGA